MSVGRALLWGKQRLRDYNPWKSYQEKGFSCTESIPQSLTALIMQSGFPGAENEQRNGLLGEENLGPGIVVHACSPNSGSPEAGQSLGSAYATP